MEFGGFEQLGQFYPVMDIIEVGGLVIWVPPETWRLVTRTTFNKCIQNELFLWRASILAAIGDWHDTGKKEEVR